MGFYFYLNEAIQWLFIGITFWAVNVNMGATSQLQKKAMADLDAYIAEQMKKLKDQNRIN